MMAVLKEAVDKRKSFLVKQLHKYDIYWTPNGQAVEDLSLTELELLHIQIKCEIGRELSKIEEEESYGKSSV
jgi:hypothetical protein